MGIEKFQRLSIDNALSAKPKNSKTFHPDEEPKPRLPDSIARPIAIMPLSRMENTTFAMPSIIDSHDMGLRTVYSPDAQKKTPKRLKLNYVSFGMSYTLNQLN
ncbi:hypothetical protein TNCV_1861391 [Trichonephila clavipes]|nr:hypothetical protein TNCV_1861391 [Trichonephila clavipes]